MKVRFVLALSLAVLPLLPAQAPERVHWSATAQPATHPGESVVTVRAAIEKGWHVYAQHQAPGGPTPLVVRLEDGAPYTLTGTITGSSPVRHHDASFDLDTEFYTDTFLLQVPVRSSKPGIADVPVTVRFQMCSETTCLPPKTVHLVARETLSKSEMPTSGAKAHL